ncbi:hypothetical protein AB3I13_05530 [Enterococcus sp. C62]|uniref:hypothetical protein n=1 Tax=Enterococcus sp. C62 TaxID=3231323 RepID=UPI0034A02A3E
MPNQKRIKSKKLKNHFISISATSILLLSSLVSSGTAIAYAAETHSLANTNQKDQNNTSQKNPLFLINQQSRHNNHLKLPKLILTLKGIINSSQVLILAKHLPIFGSSLTGKRKLSFQ